MGRKQLFQTIGVEEQWDVVIAPWLQKHADLAWRSARPTVILTPSRAESFYLRSRLVQAEISFLGLRFWTPSDARTFLLGETSVGVHPATQAELRLVARISAEKLARSSNDPTLASVEREPGLFLRAYDLLLGAGWDPAKEGAAYGRKLAREMERALKESRIATQSGLHRLLLRQVAKMKEPLLPHLLVSGFNATHWPLWDLLRATVATAEETTLSLLSPRPFGDEVDQLWIGSWEEEMGVATEIPESGKIESEGPFVEWVGSYERGVAMDAGESDFSFLATPDLSGQVQAIVLQTLDYLRNESCQRLGIVFPEQNALALGVAEELRRLGVPLNDGAGYLQPGVFEQRAWPAWLSLQEEASVQRLIGWLRVCEAEGISCGANLPARELADLLDDALGETLIDDLSFLSRHLEENSKRVRAREVAGFLRARFQLPESGTFFELFAATRHALLELGWTRYLEQREPPEWMRAAKWPCSRRAFLQWLEDSTDSQERTRGANGNHFYGKVHLLIYAQMPGQTWTHLILTGLNEGAWPRLFESGAFGSRHELMELNRQARALNRRGTHHGAQGEGHEAVLQDHSHCLLPLERQELAVRDLCAALESTAKSVCFTAMTAEAGRALLPSDFFVHAYQAKTGRVLDESAFSLLARSTAAWCEKHLGLLPAAEAADDADIAATRIAYAARRDREQSFGLYEYAFAEPPKEPIQLACKTWETAWNHPAAIWLEKIVGVSQWPEGQLGWARAVGTWVHRWLTSSLERCRETGEIKDFLPLLREAAEHERQRTVEQAASALSPWWRHVWGEARAIALGLGDSLAPQLQERFFLSEYRLPASRLVALPGTERADFELRGQIDLLLIEPGAVPFNPTSGSFADCGCWVIDFKTGSAKNLTPAKLEKGIGLQTMLYALAVRAAGSASIAVSLHTFDAPLKPQVQLAQVEANVRLFRSLDRLHRAGIFGQRPVAETDYAFAPTYPMATRSITSDILEAKWALTHGAAAMWEES